MCFTIRTNLRNKQQKATNQVIKSKQGNQTLKLRLKQGNQTLKLRLKQGNQTLKLGPKQGNQTLKLGKYRFTPYR